MLIHGKEASVEYISTKYNIPKVEVEDIIDSYNEYIYKVLLAGQNFRIKNIGTFSIKPTKPKEGRYGIDFYKNLKEGKKEKIWLEPVESYSRVSYKCSPKLKKELKELTYGKPYKTLGITEDDEVI